MYVVYVGLCGVCKGVWCMQGCVVYIKVCGVCRGVWCMLGCVLIIYVYVVHVDVYVGVMHEVSGGVCMVCVAV